MEKTNAQAYWQATLSLITKCLIVWFIVSYLFGLILVDVLNTIQIGGAGLGLWFAQQGSIYVFVALIFYYAKKMNEIDKKFNFDEE